MVLSILLLGSPSPVLSGGVAIIRVLLDPGEMEQKKKRVKQELGDMCSAILQKSFWSKNKTKQSITLVALVFQSCQFFLFVFRF